MRYTNDRTIKAGTTRATNRAAIRLRQAFNAGNIDVTTLVIGDSLRLDHVAFRYLGDPAMWWTIAALSDIGWGMQLPAGTIIIVPIDLGPIKAIVG